MVLSILKLHVPPWRLQENRLGLASGDCPQRTPRFLLIGVLQDITLPFGSGDVIFIRTSIYKFRGLENSLNRLFFSLCRLCISIEVL